MQYEKLQNFIRPIFLIKTQLINYPSIIYTRFPPAPGFSPKR